MGSFRVQAAVNYVSQPIGTFCGSVADLYIAGYCTACAANTFGPGGL